MEDAEGAEQMINQFFDFQFLRYGRFFIKIGPFSVNFEYKIDHNSENKNRKIGFSFVSAHCAYIIRMGPYLI